MLDWSPTLLQWLPNLVVGGVLVQNASRTGYWEVCLALSSHMDSVERSRFACERDPDNGEAVASFYASIVSTKKNVITIDSDDDDDDDDGDVAIVEERAPACKAEAEATAADIDIVCGFVCEVCKIQVTTMSEKMHRASSLHLINVAAANKSPPAQTYVIPRGNIGYRMLLRSGWEEGTGLGRNGEGVHAPVKTRMKNDRLGLGSKSASKLRVTHTSLPPRTRSPERCLPGDVEQANVFTALRRLRESKRRQQPLSGVSKRQRQLRAKRDRVYTRILNEELRGTPSLRDLAE